MPASKLASVHGSGAAGGAPTTTGVQESARKTRRQRASADGGGDEDAKRAGGKTEYVCRFCTTKFEKSQALGGHMNRHRQEREKEQFHHAQQIVSSATHQQYVAPPISFGTLYQPTSPTNCNLRTQPSFLPEPNCNYYVPSNASNYNNLGNNNNVQNQHNQHQLPQWIGSMDGFSNAASLSPRSVPYSGSGSFHHPHPLENNMASSLQATGIPSEILANIMLRNSTTPNDGSSLQVSPNIPTSLQVSGMSDVLYNLPGFYNGGM